MTPYELYALLRTQLELPADKAREEVSQLVQAIEEAQNGDYEEESLTL
jgi:hypothetical protein